MVFIESPLLLSAILVLTATTFFFHLLSKLNAKRKRRAQLAAWVENALLQRKRKHHSCLDNDYAEDNGIREETFYTARETRNLILTGKLNAAENLVRLARRCRRYGRADSVNAITEEFYDEGYQVALGLDPSKDELKKNSDEKLLYGVPISIKDTFMQKGAFQTGGLACRTEESLRAKDDSGFVHILRVHGGALPIVRGNVPQLMMLPECENYIWGRTCNPWNLKRSPGGSSGGDAALVAMKCVPLAVGTDVAGSIRIPASYCGVIGFKPSNMRMGTKGAMKPRKNNRMGSSAVLSSVAGPIARTVDDCVLFLRSVWIPEYYKFDNKMVPLPFNLKVYEKKASFTIGYFVTDDWFEPCDAVKRGLLETITALEKAGHKCVPFSPPVNGWEVYLQLLSLNGADGNFRCYMDALEGEKLNKNYRTLYGAANLPNFLRPFLRKILDKRRGCMINCLRSGGLSVHEYWDKISDLQSFVDKWEKGFADAGIEAVIHPALPLPALRHGDTGNLTAAFSYTFLANMLKWPAGVIPVTTVREHEQHYKFENLPENQKDCIANFAADTMKESAGLPVSVAVMTPGYQDENCLRVMKEIEQIIKFESEPLAYKEIHKT